MRSVHSFISSALFGVAMAATLLMAAPRGAQAFDQVLPFSGPFSKVTQEHYRVQLQGHSYYTEEFSFRGYLDDGAVFNAQFMITNVGVGNHKAGVNAWYRPKGESRINARVERRRGRWSHQANPPKMQVGNSYFTGGPGEITLVIADGDLEAEVTFKNILPPWRPGNGRAYFGSDRKQFYDLTILAPKAEVSGRVKIGGEWKAISGYGYADHKVGTVAPHHQARTWVRFQAFEGDWTILMQEFILPTRFGGGRVPWLLIGYKDRLVFQSVVHSLEPGKMQRDSRFGYRYPMVLTVSGEERGRTLKGTLTGTKLTSKKDMLEDLGRVERAVVGRLAKPVAYYFDANFDLKLDVDGTIYNLKGEGRYDIKHVNPE